jgi:ubiquinone/menaquinone biosynthesis C-methylase UbiE
MVGAAARRLARYGNRASATEANATTLPFAADTFDVALSFLMLHHVGKWEAALHELVRVVRPGGRVIGCDVAKHRFIEWAERGFGTGDERLISPDDFGTRSRDSRLARMAERARRPVHVPLCLVRLVRRRLSRGPWLR